MSILTVRATTITIGQIVVDAYTADEQRPDGSYVNYLSGNGLAESIGLSNSTTVLKSQCLGSLGLEGYLECLGSLGSFLRNLVL